MQESAERDPASAATSRSQGEDQSEVCDQKQVSQSATSASEPQDQSQLSSALLMAPGKLDFAGWVRAIDNLQPALQKLLGRVTSRNVMATVHSIIARFRTQKQPVPVDLVTLVGVAIALRGDIRNEAQRALWYKQCRVDVKKQRFMECNLIMELPAVDQLEGHFDIDLNDLKLM